MSRNISLPLLLVSLIFITSCSNNANQVLIRDIEMDSGQNSVSLFTIEPDRLINEFPNHLFGALRPSERELFENHLTTIFSRQTSTSVNGLINHHLITDHNFDVRNFELRSGNMTMISPKMGTQITNGDNSDRFVLILDQFFFTQFMSETGGNTYAGHETTFEERLRFETKYLIWDNQIQDAVAWGKINTHTLLDRNNQQSTYVELISNAFSQIVRVSPFRYRIS